MSRILEVAVGAALLSLACAAAAQAPIVYPAKGQSPNQQKKDDGDCYVWAKQSTGVDPAAASRPVQAAPTPQGPQGGMVKGAVVGGLIGAAGGNDVGSAAAKGALIGGVAQHARKRGQQQQAAQQQQQQQAAQQQNLNTYYRAYGACMSGRGYTIS